MGEVARGASLGRRAGRVNGALIMAEIALSVVLVAGAGLMLKSFRQLSSQETGFDSSRLLTMRVVLPAGGYDSLPPREAFYGNTEARVRALPGVTEVGFVNYLPLSGAKVGIPFMVQGVELPPDAPGQVVTLNVASPGYLDALRVRLQRGRMFGPQDAADGESVVVVNEAFVAEYFPDGAWEGRSLGYPNGDLFGVVVGVLPDMRRGTLAEPPEPEVFVPAGQWGWNTAFLVVRTEGDPMASRDAVVAAVREMEPDAVVLDTRSMDDVIHASLGSPRFYARLFGFFAVLALLLAVVGVYGVVSYTVGQRTREIGIRKALGATSASVLTATVRRAMVPVVAGLVVGLAGAVASGRLLAGLLYQVPPGDPAVLAGVAAVLLGAGAAASAVPALRAMRLPAASALRSE